MRRLFKLDSILLCIELCMYVGLNMLCIELCTYVGGECYGSCDRNDKHAARVLHQFIAGILNIFLYMHNL